MGYRSWLGIALGSCVITLSSVGAAAPERFGSQGQVVIYHPLLFASHSDSYEGAGAGVSSTTIQLAPAAAVFVLPSFSVGGRLSWSRTWWDFGDDGSSTSNSIGIAPEIGYALPLGEHFTIWPQAYVALSRSTSSSDPGAHVSVSAGGFAPLLWHPVDHVFVGLGPSAHWSFGGPRLGDLSKNDRTLVLASTFGGYF